MLYSNSQSLIPTIIALLLVTGCANISPTSKNSEITVYTQQADQAFSLMNGGHMKVAIPVLKQLAVDHPNRAEPYVNMSIAYRQLGLAEQSIDAIQDARSIDPKSSTAAHQLGILYREQGDFQASKKAYEQAIQINPGYALAHRNLGILFDLYLQKPRIALQHYEQYLTLSHDVDKEVSFWVADIKQRLPATEKTVSR